MSNVLRWILALLSLWNLGGMLSVFALYRRRHYAGTGWWIMHLPAHVWMMAMAFTIFTACGVGIAFAGIDHELRWYGTPGFLFANVFVAAGLRRILHYRQGKEIEATKWGQKRLTDPGGPTG